MTTPALRNKTEKGAAGPPPPCPECLKEIEAEAGCGRLPLPVLRARGEAPLTSCWAHASLELKKCFVEQQRQAYERRRQAQSWSRPTGAAAVGVWIDMSNKVERPPTIDPDTGDRMDGRNRIVFADLRGPTVGVKTFKKQSFLPPIAEPRSHHFGGEVQ